MSNILFGSDLSAESYAAVLIASLVNVKLDVRSLDVYPGKEHLEEPFLSINPLGTIPVLQTDSGTLRDWQAILLKIATIGPGQSSWLPQGDALPKFVEWLGFARELGLSAGLVRLHDSIGEPANPELCRKRAHALLRELERSLWFGERDGRLWIGGRKPSIADVAIFVHVIFCEEGGVDRMDYPAVRRWIDRVRRLDGFVAVSGVFPMPSEQPAALASEMPKAGAT